MSHALVEHDARRGSVLRAEVHRFRARRMVRWLVLAAALLFVALTAVAFTQYARPGADDVARAQAKIAASVVEQDGYRQQCLSSGVPDGQDPDEFCGPAAVASDYELRYYLDTPPFTLGEDYVGYATATGIAAGALAFVLGVTFVGAEWSQRTMVALLFWQPRRGVVVSRKLAVATVAGALLAAALAALWVGVAWLLGTLRGSNAVPDGFWLDVLATVGRTTLLGGLLGLGGAGLANLVRGTGAALGVAFAYLVLAETAVRALGGASQQYLLSLSAEALLQLQGASVYLYENTVQPDGSVASTSREIAVSGLQGGLVITGVVAVVVALGTVLFVRRDLQ